MASNASSPRVPVPSGRKGTKLRCLPIEEKLKILDRIEAGVSVAIVCEEFKIKRSTFYDIKKTRDKLRGFALQMDEPGFKLKTRKRMITAKYLDLEEAVFKWYKQERSAGLPVRGIDIQAAAERLAAHLNVEGFKASPGWLFKFRNRHCLANRKVVGESLSADMTSVEPFRDRLKTLLSATGLLRSQLYNADETGLYWKNIPVNTQASKTESHTPGRKVSKDRLSALVCANADGSHRCKTMIVGKARTPRALRTVMDRLPAHYGSSKSAWFTREIFHSWFHKHFVPEVKKFQTDELHIDSKNVKALLLLDNAPAHPAVEQLTSRDGKIKVMFLPPNTTSVIQPMDQGVIESCKRLYRNKLVTDCFVVLEDETDLVTDTRGARSLEKIKKYNIKNAIYNWAESWKQLPGDTLTNAWGKLLHDTDVEVDFQGFTPDDFVNIMRTAGETEVTEENIIDWLETDSQDPGYHHESVEDIAASVSEASPEPHDSDEDVVALPQLSLSRVRDGLDDAMEYIDACKSGDLQKYYPMLRELRSKIVKRQFAHFKQPRIHDFFKPSSKDPRVLSPQPSTSSDSSTLFRGGVTTSDSDSGASTSGYSAPKLPSNTSGSDLSHISAEVPLHIDSSDSD